MFHYRILIAAGVLQIILLFLLPALNFLIKPLFRTKKWRFIALALFWAVFTAIWLASMGQIYPFSFSTGAGVLLLLIYALSTALPLWLIRQIYRFRQPEQTFNLCYHKSSKLEHFIHLHIMLVKKLLVFILALLFSCVSFAQVDPKTLLKPIEAFAPQLTIKEDMMLLQFNIAEGYYLYRNKISIKPNQANLFKDAQYPKGEEKTDDFFGKQEIYRNSAIIILPYTQNTKTPNYTVEIEFQGCADVGICYPPDVATFVVDKIGDFQPNNLPVKRKKIRDIFLSQGKSIDEVNPNTTIENNTKLSKFKLSRTRMGANLLAFFLAGIGLSFTACMYPLIPIVSSSVLGKGKVSKARAFLLSFIYVQGLALTYTAIGVLAGTTGSLLTVWLQQPAVILTAAALLVLLALSMFGVFSFQVPLSIQQFFTQKSYKLKGGKAISVFLMGMFSALIVGPCIAPPLAFALAYIGQTGDALLGGLSLYALAIGTGLPLIAVSMFGAYFLPKAGNWMRGVQIFFGCLMLSAAVYLATPFLPQKIVIAAYSLILLIPGGLLLARQGKFSNAIKPISLVLGTLLICGSFYLAYNGLSDPRNSLHSQLNLLPEKNNIEKQNVFIAKEDLDKAIEQAFLENPNTPVLIDFYADWCISCREMNKLTFSQNDLWQHIDKERFFTIDVTENTESQRELLKEYGLFGPPGIFVLKSPKQRSEAFIGFATHDELINWINQQTQQLNQ